MEAIPRTKWYEKMFDEKRKQIFFSGRYTAIVRTAALSQNNLLSDYLARPVEWDQQSGLWLAYSSNLEDVASRIVEFHKNIPANLAAVEFDRYTLGFNYNIPMTESSEVVADDVSYSNYVLTELSKDERIKLQNLVVSEFSARRQKYWTNTTNVRF